MTTSLPSRPRSWCTMPLSIASLTISSAPTGAAACSTPTRPRTTTCRRCPGRYAPRRESPLLCLGNCAHLLTEQRTEDRAARQKLIGRAGLDDASLVEHDGAVGDLDRREALCCDQDGAAR